MIFIAAPHHTDNLKTKAPNTTGSNHLCNTLELLMMRIMVPETCWASNKICNKNHLLHLVGILFPHISTSNTVVKNFTSIRKVSACIFFLVVKTKGAESCKCKGYHDQHCTMVSTVPWSALYHFDHHNCQSWWMNFVFDYSFVVTVPCYIWIK